MSDGSGLCLRRAGLRRAFTLIDMMLVIVIMGILAMMTLPSIGANQPLKLIGAATILASDLEFAQSETLVKPADPTVLRVDLAAGRYWLARASTPDTPIDRPEAGTTATGPRPYEVLFGQGDMQFLEGIQCQLEGVSSGVGTVPFDAFGRLSQTQDARLRVYNDSGDLFVVVSATTGTVSIVE